MIQIRRGIAFLLLGVFFAGCASVSVKDGDRSRVRAPKRKPVVVYVMPFSTQGATFNVDREGAELETFKHDTAVMLADVTAERITAQLAPARIVGAGDSLPGKGWLLKGRFITVNQGSRALRSFVGLGAGATKMQVEVEVYDIARSRSAPFLTFETEGGSGSMPGLITSPGPVAAGLSVVGGSLRGVTDDAQRTARMITARLSQYMLERKWIRPEQATAIKTPLGTTPLGAPTQPRKTAPKLGR